MFTNLLVSIKKTFPGYYLVIFFLKKEAKKDFKDLEKDKVPVKKKEKKANIRGRYIKRL